MSVVACLIVMVLSASFSTPGTVEGQQRQQPKVEDPEGRKLSPPWDLLGATKDFGFETWMVASSPVRLDRHSAIKLGGVLLVGGVLLALDEQIQKELQAGGEPDGLYGAVTDLGDFIEPISLQSNTNVYWAGAAVLGYFTRQDWLRDPAKQILFSHWIGGLGRQFAGWAVGRSRPESGAGPYEFDPGEGTSFPSGHSAAAFELAYILSHHIHRRPATVVLYGLAGLTAFQRAESNAHWMSDAWFGAAWGFLVAKTVVSAEESDRFEVAPAIDLRNGRSGVGLTIRF